MASVRNSDLCLTSNALHADNNNPPTLTIISATPVYLSSEALTGTGFKRNEASHRDRCLLNLDPGGSVLENLEWRHSQKNYSRIIWPVTSNKINLPDKDAAGNHHCRHNDRKVHTCELPDSHTKMLFLHHSPPHDASKRSADRNTESSIVHTR
jgi:hypothetical protein